MSTSFDNPTPTSDQTGTAKGLSALNVIAGIWLILSPFIVGYADLAGPMWNSIIVGGVVLVLAAIRAANPLHAVALSWINALLGVWLIIAPFVLVREMRTPGLTWNDVILGIVVLVLGAGSALATSTTGSRMGSRTYR
jgi:hypothetical protein